MNDSNIVLVYEQDNGSIGGVEFLDSLIALYDQNTFSKMVAQTFVSLHLYGYGTVLATSLQKIFTTDGSRPRSTTRFYNGFGVDSMYMTTESMARFSLPEVRGTA